MPHWRRKGSPYRYGYVYDRDDNRTAIRSLRVRDPKAADAKLREWEREVSDPAYAASKGCTARQAIDGFMKHYRQLEAVGKKSKATIGYYEDKTGTLIRVLGEPCRLGQIDAALVDRYIAARRKETASEHTIKKELDALKVVLGFAKRAGWWGGDAKAVFPKFSADYEPRDRNLDTDEIVALLGVLPSRDVAAQMAFAIATSAEAACLPRAQKADISADCRYVLLRGSKREHRWRTVPVVTEWQKRMLAFALKHAEGKELLLFRCTEWGLRNGLFDACKRLDIDHASPNDLRRTFAVHMREAGFPLELIAPLMGHKDTRMLEKVYGRLSPQQLQARLLLTMQLVANAKGVERVDSAGTGRTEEVRPQVLQDRPLRM